MYLVPSQAWQFTDESICRLFKVLPNISLGKLEVQSRATNTYLCISMLSRITANNAKSVQVNRYRVVNIVRRTCQFRWLESHSPLRRPA